MKRAVLELNMATAPFLDPLEELQRARVGPVGAELAEYIRDVYDHLLKVVQDLQRSRELLTNAMDLPPVGCFDAAQRQQEAADADR